MSILKLDDLENGDLHKRLLTQINLEDWPDECTKCGQPKLLHRELHRVATCVENREVPEVLNRIWMEYKKRIKPILSKIKEIAKKDSEQEIMLQGLENLVKKITSQNIDNMKVLMDSVKKDSQGVEPSGNSPRMTKLTKPVKVPSWSKDMLIYMVV